MNKLLRRADVDTLSSLKSKDYAGTDVALVVVDRERLLFTVDAAAGVLVEQMAKAIDAGMGDTLLQHLERRKEAEARAELLEADVEELRDQVQGLQNAAANALHIDAVKSGELEAARAELLELRHALVELMPAQVLEQGLPYPETKGVRLFALDTDALLRLLAVLTR